MDNQDNMATLIKRRGTLKGQLTRFMNDVKEFKADSDIGILKTKRNKVEECWQFNWKWKCRQKMT